MPQRGVGTSSWPPAGNLDVSTLEDFFSWPRTTSHGHAGLEDSHAERHPQPALLPVLVLQLPVTGARRAVVCPPGIAPLGQHQGAGRYRVAMPHDCAGSRAVHGEPLRGDNVGMRWGRMCGVRCGGGPTDVVSALAGDSARAVGSSGACLIVEVRVPRAEVVVRDDNFERAISMWGEALPGR